MTNVEKIENWVASREDIIEYFDMFKIKDDKVSAKEKIGEIIVGSFSEIFIQKSIIELTIKVVHPLSQ